MFGYPAAWTRITWLTVLLLPLSWLFRAGVALRRAAYRAGWLRSVRLPVPVIVVGNISVGGTGKTPLVIWLAAQLKLAGYTPGIVSRGYGGSARAPRAVAADDDPAQCGDEPVLLARHTACPVWIGADRVAAARALRTAHAGCDVIISDDGLQHYRLARDAEVAVVDGARGLGNGRLLPAGPLREPPARLREVDAVVLRQPAAQPARYADRQFGMSLEPAALRDLSDPTHRETAAFFQGKRVHAVAGIGNPPQFFDMLTGLGIVHTAHAYPDHHAFSAADLQFSDCDAVVMTEKDAVKCERYAATAPDRYWALEVEARVDAQLLPRLLQRIKR